MSSASEAELTALYYSCMLAAQLRTILEELSHFQLTPTPVTTYNFTAQGLTMGTITPKASKSMNQQFHWFKCWHAQCQFQYLWRKCIRNRADYSSKHHDYSSKHHAPKHHQNVRPFFVFDNITFPKQWSHMSPWHSCHHILVIQCQHNGPLFLTTTQVDCPLARVW